VDIDRPRPSSSSTAKESVAVEWQEELLLENIATLEQRMNRIEKLVGSAANAVLTGHPQGNGPYPLSETLTKLEQRLERLDVDSLERAKYAAGDLQRSLEGLSRDKERASELLKAASAIEGLRTKVDGVTAVAGCLPDLVRFQWSLHM
jgi:Dynamitin